MQARLVAIDGGPDIPLNRALWVVGRDPSCDTRLDSSLVSRHHCCLSLEHGAVVVRDLGSTNGIRINGHRVGFGRLRPGDELSIAHRRYRFDDGQGPDRDREAFLKSPRLPSSAPPQQPANPKRPAWTSRLPGQG
jgi:pSer/pThr/pTyr-binding forkhead associated (FHA) protein